MGIGLWNIQDQEQRAAFNPCTFYANPGLLYSGNKALVKMVEPEPFSFRNSTVWLFQVVED